MVDDEQRTDLEIIADLLKLLNKDQKDIAINYLHSVINIE